MAKWEIKNRKNIKIRISAPIRYFAIRHSLIV